MPAQGFRYTICTTVLAAALALLPAGSVAAAMSDSATVTLKEWQLSLSAADASAGKVNLTVNNTGNYTHALEIERNGKEVARTDNIPAGGEATLAVTLKPGTYAFYCPIDGHRDQGLNARIKVSQNSVSVVGNGGKSESDNGGRSYGY